MANIKNGISKLDRLTMLRDTLIECKKGSVKDADEWQTYHDMLERVKDMLTEERRKQGWMAVYPIVDGSAQESLFEGTKEQCKIYVSTYKEIEPNTDIIVLKL